MEIYQAAIGVAVGVLVGVGFTQLWLRSSISTPTSSTTETPNSPSVTAEILQPEQLRLLQSQLNALEAKHARQPEPPLLESKFQLLEGQFRSLQLEWTAAHRHLDHLLRRGIRLGVLERKDQAPSPEDSPPANSASPTSKELTRHQLLQNHRARSRVQ